MQVFQGIPLEEAEAAALAAIQTYLSKVGQEAWGVSFKEGEFEFVALEKAAIEEEYHTHMWDRDCRVPVLIIPQPETAVVEKVDLGGFDTPGVPIKELSREEAEAVYPTTPSTGEDIVEDDDLPKQLRGRAAFYRNIRPWPEVNVQKSIDLNEKAADEIERLRADNQYLVGEARHIASYLRRITELEEALGWYADEDIYSDFNNQGRSEKPLILRDRGESARSALSNTQG
jgi:hypothetical protein